MVRFQLADGDRRDGSVTGCLHPTRRKRRGERKRRRRGDGAPAAVAATRTLVVLRLSPALLKPSARPDSLLVTGLQSLRTR